MTAPQARPDIMGLMIDEARSKGMAVVGFDELSARFMAERRIDVRDAMRSSNHFERWHRRRRLPRTDDEGLHYRSSRLHMRLYEEDADGEAARPPYVDLWHWLLDAFESVPWQETPSRRSKAVPIIGGMVAIPEIPTDDEIAAARRRLEAGTGPLPDEAWAALGREMAQRRAKAVRIAELVDIATAWHGGGLLLTMEVDR